MPNRRSSGISSGSFASAFAQTDRSRVIRNDARSPDSSVPMAKANLLEIPYRSGSVNLVNPQVFVRPDDKVEPPQSPQQRTQVQQQQPINQQQQLVQQPVQQQQQQVQQQSPAESSGRVVGVGGDASSALQLQFVGSAIVSHTRFAESEETIKHMYVMLVQLEQGRMKECQNGSQSSPGKKHKKKAVISSSSSGDDGGDGRTKRSTYKANVRKQAPVRKLALNLFGDFSTFDREAIRSSERRKAKQERQDISQMVAMLMGLEASRSFQIPGGTDASQFAIIGGIINHQRRSRNIDDDDVPSFGSRIEQYNLAARDGSGSEPLGGGGGGDDFGDDPSGGTNNQQEDWSGWGDRNEWYDEDYGGGGDDGDGSGSGVAPTSDNTKANRFAGFVEKTKGYWQGPVTNASRACRYDAEMDNVWQLTSRGVLWFPDRRNGLGDGSSRLEHRA